MSDSLNSAVGKIIIDTSQPQTVPGIMQGVAQGINSAMGQVSAGSNQAAAGLSAMATAARGVAGAFGVGLGVQGLKQLADAAINATQLATAYNRQEIAARNLAGSQGRLNDLLEVYSRATGGAIDDATALANVTKLMGVGFADNAGELEKFATAIRGISVAMGQSQEYVTQNLILELFSQRGQRLDQLGLQYDKVKQRADELQAADSSLTDKQAYQNAVLEEAAKRYGALAKSAAGAATGLENAGKAAKNAELEIGKLIAAPVNAGGNALAVYIEGQIAMLRTYERAWQDLYAAMQRAIGISVPTGMQQRFIESSAGREAARHGGRGGNGVNPNQAEIDATKLDWGKGIQQLNNDTNQQLLQQNQSYQEQRADSERQYQNNVSRSAQDFAIARQREEQDLADSIARIHRDSAQREQQMAEDLARNIAQEEADSAEKIANAKADTAKQIAELDQDYEKDRLKRAKDLSDNLLDAASNLDARQVYELQRDAAKQEEEAKQAHDDRRDKLQKQLQERIDDESKSLAKSIAQQRDAYDRQIEQGRQADNQRIEDMKADLKKRQDQENADYNLRMDRLRQDHNDQLGEMDRQQSLRIQQIKDHATQERTQLDTEHESALIKLGIHNQEWIDAETKLNNQALKLLEPLLEKGRSLILFPNAGSNTVPFPSMVGGNAPMPYSGVGGSTSYSSGGRTISTGPISVTIQGTTGMGETQLKRVVVDAITEALEGLP